MEQDKSIYNDEKAIIKETKQLKEIEKNNKNSMESVHKATLITYLLS